MNRVPRIRLSFGVVAGLASALLAFGAATPAAFASLPPPGPTGPAVVPAAPAPAPVHTVVTGGMPGWQTTLIAIGAALLAAAVAVLLDRARAARRRVTATAA